jgi:hypothetical protein
MNGNGAVAFEVGDGKGNVDIENPIGTTPYAMCKAWYVKSDGNDNSSGTKTAPLATVQEALTRMKNTYAGAWQGKGTPAEAYGGIVILDTVPVTSEIIINGSIYPPIVLLDDPQALGTKKLQATTPIENNSRSLLYILGGARVTLAGNLGLAGFGQNTTEIRGVEVGSSGEFTMDGGTIFDCSITGISGAGVYVSYGGTFTMNDGHIYSNSTSFAGGGVAVDGGTFTMKDGYIRDNSANPLTSAFGGGVYVINGGEFVMDGGFIHHNTATLGGGVHIKESIFTMNNGSIYSNTAVGFASDPGMGMGGGVLAAGDFNMYDGKIYNNIAEAYGGGVLIDDYEFIMSNGEISGNSAISGGGVFLEEGGGIFTMKLGGISGNTAQDSGGGVYVNNTGIDISTFSKTAGTIYGYISRGHHNNNSVMTDPADPDSTVDGKGHAVYYAADGSYIDDMM